MRDLPIRYLAAAASMNLLALLLTLGVGVWGWFSAPVLALGLVGMFLFPMTVTLCVGALVMDPTRVDDAFVTTGKDVPSAPRRILLAAAPFLFFGVCAVALVQVLWSSSSFRAWALGSAAEWGVAQGAENGLFDIDASVKLDACGVFRAGVLPVDEERLALALSGAEDAEFVSCLLAAIPPAPGPRARGVVTFKVGEWREELISSEVTAERACQTAEWIRSTERLGNGFAPADLLVCAAVSPFEATQTCCAQALRASARGLSVARSLPEPSTLSTKAWARDRAALLLLASRQGGLPAGVEENASWATAENRTWAMAHACESMRTSEASTRYAIGDALRASLADEGCTVPPMLETTYRIWDRACSIAFDGMRDDAPSALCDEVVHAVQEDALATTRLEVMRAHRHAANPTRAGRISDALLDYRRVPAGGFQPTIRRERGQPAAFEHPDIMKLFEEQVSGAGGAWKEEIQKSFIPRPR